MATEVASNDLTSEERILTSRNIEWENGFIPLSKIDLERSLMWNAREDTPGLNEYWVETYAQAYRNKEELPPIICMKTGKGGDETKLVVLSGHHRVAAAREAGLRSLAGYTTPPLSEVDRLHVIVEANRTVGYGLSENQRMEAAMRYMGLGETATAAAHLVGLDPQKVYRKAAQGEADKRLQRVSRNWTRFSAPTRARLNALQSDETLRKAIDLALAARLTGSEVNKLVRDVNKGTTDVEREEVIASMWDIYRPRTTPTKRKKKEGPGSEYLGPLRGAIKRLGNPAALSLLPDVVGTTQEGFAESVLNAEMFITQAAALIRERGNGGGS